MLFDPTLFRSSVSGFALLYPTYRLLATMGIAKAIAQSAEIRSALNTNQGKIANKVLAEATGFTTT